MRTLTYREIPFVIVKPVASSRGRGIRVYPASRVPSLLRDIKKKKGRRRRRRFLFQRYIHDPLLVNNLKFDIRLYVLVTSFNPLVLFLFEVGIVRFCTSTYSTDTIRSKGTREGHLTNYSVCKESDAYVENASADRDAEGHKWSFSALLNHFRTQRGVDVDRLLRRIESCIVKTFIAVEDHVISAGCRASHVVNTSLGGNCFELFGFDIMLDESMKPWVIEVNTSPSLTSKSPLDKRVKFSLFSDIIHLVGVSGPSRHDRKDNKVSATTAKATRLSYVLGKAAIGRTPAKRPRHSLPSSSSRSSEAFENRRLVNLFKDQLHRRGHFRAIFPSVAHEALYGLFPFERPKNAVMRRWIEKSRKHRQRRAPQVRPPGAGYSVPEAKEIVERSPILPVV